jgi:hypothetical protein
MMGAKNTIRTHSRIYILAYARYTDILRFLRYVFFITLDIPYWIRAR